MHRGGYRSLQIKGKRGRRPSSNPKPHRVTCFFNAADYTELVALAAANDLKWEGIGVTPGRQAGEMLSRRLQLLAARRAAESVNLES